MNGIGFTFPSGTSVAPGGFLLLVEDRQAFGTEFGWTISVAGEFPGALDNGGESLTLLHPGGAPGEFVEIDRVRSSSILRATTAAPRTGRLRRLAVANRTRWSR